MKKVARVSKMEGLIEDYLADINEICANNIVHSIQFMNNEDDEWAYITYEEYENA